MTYDIARIRACYPALADGSAYLDGAAGTQVPLAVIEAEAAAYRAGIGNTGGAFAASRRSAGHTAAARAAIADLTGAPDPSCVVLGPSSTALIYRMAEALSQDWGPGDEVVVTRLDHDANVRPWVQAATVAGATVRWADPDLPGLDLPVDSVTGLIGERTRLVAVTAASNVVGTRPDVAAIAAAAHGVGAVVAVDGVHATPHGPIDVVALGADLFTTSAYKWSGPHLAAVVGRPEVLEAARPARLAPASGDVPKRFERGTPPFAQHAGAAAAVDHLAALCPDAAPGAEPTRRERLVASLGAVAAHEAVLLERLLDGLGSLERVRRIGAPTGPAPTVWFTVEGTIPTAVAEACAAAGVNVWAGHNYAWELAGLLGIRDSGSAVRAGMSCYSDASDVDRLLEVLGDLGG